MSDPVAEKIFKQIDSLPKIELPEDRSISTLYIGGLDGVVTEKDLRCVAVCVHVCMCAYVHVCMCAHVCVRVHVCECVCVMLVCVHVLCRSVNCKSPPVHLLPPLPSPPLSSLPCRDHYYQYGEVRAIHMAAEQNCAFVTFSAREAAEAVRGRRRGNGGREGG